ncbi:alpha/beta hydrolase family protein [Yinghuangia sp. ASG 101]|uniref:alpha/beta hydrolase n=1 Tax=Yinghuangia sp. ASG 101 TaxID=2896848 RepID=UPI001E51F633|nr:alpha/beta hydrolase [Yinghuangia sp. ASG 101]UGQ09189.1 alpha/beta hydrolase family protein [Yinghuangia sp. ASG 101]
MPTVSRLRDADLGALHRARVAWSALVTALEAARHDAGATVATPLRASRWFGPAADGAYRDLERLSDDLLHATAQARLVATLLDDIHELFSAKQRELRPLLAAAPGRYLVHEDGSVAYRHDRAAAVDAPREHAASAIPAIMKAVGEADARFAAALRQLDVIARTDTNPTSWQGHAQDTRAVAALAGVDLAAVPRDDPVAAAAWWASLTEARRQEYIAFAPRLVGMTDGLPAAVRDHVNRLTLKQEKFVLHKELDRLVAMSGAAVRSTLPPKYRDPRALRNVVDAVRERLDGITALEARIGGGLGGPGDPSPPSDHPVPPAFLLNYSLAGHGQAVVSVGNPDTADNVTISVPGTGAGLAKAAHEIERATAIQAAATAADPAKRTASIAWVGYEAPQSIVKDATRPVFAEHAAPRLARFDAGLDAARRSPSAHVSVIGHSYGSLVVGKSLADEGLTVDKCVIIGSPGVGVDHARDLKMPPANVYAGSIPEDPVAMLAVYGVNPTWEEFGARDLPVPPAPHSVLPVDRDAHAKYWDRDSPSLTAMGRIAAGQRP